MSEAIVWTAEAEVMLKEIPFFVRPFARKKIEAYAKDNSIPQITVEIYEDAKRMFNKKFN
jgi:Proto-chlorophyllide reductase 57 kD subunit